jgi:hypothetical protein
MWLILLIFVAVVAVLLFPNRTVQNSPAPPKPLPGGRPRKSPETCLWLQRLIAAGMDAMASTNHMSNGCRALEARAALSLEERGLFREVCLRIVNVGRSPPRITAITASANSSNPCSIEAEVELDYDGGAELTFRALCMIAFSRALSIEAKLSKLSFSCCARITAEIRLDGEAECALNVTLVDEPRFQCDLETSVGNPLRLRNSWLVAYAVRYAILRVVRRRLIARGVALTFPLGPDWTHGGMLWGGDGGLAASGATSEANWPPAASGLMRR